MVGRRTRCAAGVAAIAIALFTAACGSDSSTGDTTGSGGGGGGKQQTLYAKYGGQATVDQIVGQAITGLTSDPKVSPFFAVIGKKGHDSGANLTGCLEAFFNNALGGPGAYPTKLADGFECRDMKAAQGQESRHHLDRVRRVHHLDLGGVLKEEQPRSRRRTSTPSPESSMG